MEAKIPATLRLDGNLSENFRRFKQNFEIYLKATGKVKESDDVKLAIFLNIIGEDGVDVYNTLKLSEDERNDYTKVLQEFEKYANPRKNVVYERFKFFSRKQGEGEAFDHYLTDVKKLSTTCEFGEQQESLIRDRIVLGISDRALQERLLAREDLSLNKAESECRAAEITKGQIRNVQNNEQVLAVVKKDIRKNVKEEENKNVFEGPWT